MAQKKLPRQKLTTCSAEETKNLAAKIAKNLQGGKVLALYGDLGSGKTTFAQGIAKALGIKEKVQSPTFVLLKQYKIILKRKTKKEKPHPKIKNLIHFDLYRIKSEREARGIGLIEYFNQPNTVVLIEWPEIVEKILPNDTIKIHFNHLSESKRIITIQ